MKTPLALLGFILLALPLHADKTINDNDRLNAIHRGGLMYGDGSCCTVRHDMSCHARTEYRDNDEANEHHFRHDDDSGRMHRMMHRDGR